MYRFGQWIDEPLSADGLPDFHAAAQCRLESLSEAVVDDTLRVFDRLQSLWSPGGEFFARAVQADQEDSQGASPIPGITLKSAPRIISRLRWEQRLRAELPHPAILDGAVPLPQGVARAFPLGVVLHSFPSGSGVDFIDSLLACLLTRNVPVLLIPRAWRRLARLFLGSLEKVDGRGCLAGSVAAFCQDESGFAALRAGVERVADGVVAWTGAAMPKRGEGGMKRRVRVIQRSQQVLVGVISKAFWDSCDRRRIIEMLAAENAVPGGSGIERLQTLYVESGLDLASKLHARPRATGGARHSLEIQAYDSVVDLCRIMEQRPEAATCCVCGLSGAARSGFLDRLGRSGVTRVIPFDAFPDRADCRISDGLPLRELVRIVADERDDGVRELLREVAEFVPYYRERAPDGDVSKLDAWPFLTGADLAQEPLHRSRKLLHSGVSAGSIFSSGGTSTAPKYALYTQTEMSRSTDMLARGFLANGLRPGDRAINLFVAGHLWSAFLAVDEALRHCGAYVLPMGGLAPIDDIVSCLSSFRPQVAFGLPSLLVGYARHCENAGIDVTVERIFYAGEHFNPSARDYVKRIWKTESFHSAGYAAVDVGPIGWQCAFSQDGEHHLFSNDVHLEIVDEEAVVTSLVRRAMPVVRYRTGDRVEWLSSECPCGSRDPRFRLLGRVDGLINIWGCRVAYEDVERALLEAGLQAPVLQLVIREASDSAAQMEQLVVRLEQSASNTGFFERFVANLHRYSRDLSVALDVAALTQRVTLECVPPDTIPRIVRTGKIRLIVDERGSAH